MEMDKEHLKINEENILMKPRGGVIKLVYLFGLNIFYSGIKYTENDWVRLKVRRYPFQSIG